MTHRVHHDGVDFILNKDGLDIIDIVFPTTVAFIENAFVDINMQLNTGGHEELTSAEKATITSWQDALKGE